MAASHRWIRSGRPALLVGTLLLGGGLVIARPALARGPDEPETVRLLRGRVEMLRSGLEARAGGQRLLAVMALPTFYDGRAFEPVWTDAAGLRALAQLREAIDRSADHGLHPDDYHRAAIDELAGRIRSGVAQAADSADLDLLASDAFMVLGSHLLQGRVNPETIDPEWLANRRASSFQTVLADALASGRIEATLYDLAPTQPRYQAMLAALARLRRTAARGGWADVPDGPKLELGMSGPRVAALRERLAASGDLPSDLTEVPSDEYDEDVQVAVRRFQTRHGLDVDGVVGPATLTALEVPAALRVAQVEINLERWRWLPEDLGQKHIEVNIAGFEVRVVESGRTVQVHRAVVGRLYRQTPMFSGTMTYLVLSPYWHVPPTIAAVDKLPAIKRDPGYLAAQNMTLLDQRTNEPVDPGTVDWSTLDGPTLNRRYRIRQSPGPMNALGAVKFMFPNQHNVYLHDTPSRELFSRTSRSFSSGCIRIENPLELAEYLLADRPGWDRARIDAAIRAGEEEVVRLTAGVPVHLLYWTAWAEADGTINFRDDIYGRDTTVRRAIEAAPPGI